jgi:hypothetical protein
LENSLFLWEAAQGRAYTTYQALLRTPLIKRTLAALEA